MKNYKRLLRFARNDRKGVVSVIARRAATKQSQEAAEQGLFRFARNDRKGVVSVIARSAAVARRSRSKPGARFLTSFGTGSAIPGGSI